jgi:hypothetical protein
MFQIIAMPTIEMKKKIPSPSPTGKMKRNEPFDNFHDILPKNQKNELIS